MAKITIYTIIAAQFQYGFSKPWCHVLTNDTANFFTPGKWHYGLVSVDMCHNVIERLPSSTSLLSTRASPVSLPPVTKPATAPGIPFLSSTLDTIFVTAIAHNGVVGDGFQIVAFPAANERARFLKQWKE